MNNNNNNKQRLTVSSINLANNKKQKQPASQQQQNILKKKSLPMKDKNKSLLKLSSQKLSCITNSRSLQNKSQTSMSFKKPKCQLHQPPPNTAKLSLNEKIQIIQESQSKLQSQYKMLFECVGELWENNKITRYVICY